MLLLRVFLGRHRLGNSYEENTKRLNFVCAYCLIWAVGSAIEQVHYGELETLLRAQLQSIFLPKTETIFDFYLQPDTQVGFVSWESKLCDYEF